MKFGAIMAAIFLLFTCLSLPDEADAARMGGGRSFGSNPSMSRPAQRPAQHQQAPAAQTASSKPGMFGGMGGLFGGLLAGTLLGSLLSGNGAGGGGFMDLLLIAILAFLGWKLYTRFRNQQAARGSNPAGGYAGNPNSMQRNDSGWNQMGARPDTASSEPRRVESWRSFPGSAPADADAKIDIPAGFDQEDFLKGAKMVYTRLQKSWDNRDLQDISQFATRAVMKELTLQAQEDPNPSQTELVMVNAQLIGVEPEGDNLRAQVYFDVLMREDPAQATPGNVREIWHFLRIGQNGNWKLDGIQQVE